MRIAFDHQVFCGQSHGGISRYFVNVAQQLVMGSEDVAIFAPLHRNAYLKSLPPSVVRGVGVDWFPPHSTELIRHLNRYLARPAMRQWAPGVVHETYYSAHGNAPRGCPIVVTVYDMIHERFPQAFKRRDQTARYKPMAIARADHVICISERTRLDLIELLGIPDDKVSVVHLGVEQLRVSRADGQSPVAVGEHRPVLLYVGGRRSYKNFFGLVRAVGGSQRLRGDFDIVAFGGGPLTGQEKRDIVAAGMKVDRVHQVGGDDLMLARLFAQAAALVYPSLYEGFGLPPLEAMVYRCPVVSSNAGSLPEVIGDSAEFFDPTDPAAIADAIERVVYSPERAAELVRLGTNRHGRFTWQDCARQTLQIYKSVTR